MGIFFAVFAALMASTNNFLMRKSIDKGGSSKGYLVVQLTLSFLFMIFLNPIRTGNYTFDGLAILFGLIGGLFLGSLMWGLGKTLENGPAGLSFAVLNSSSIMPAVLMALFFGATMGHSYSFFNGLGSFLVVCGLFWAGWTTAPNPQKKRWVLFATLIFTIHTFFLAYLQWWALILKPDLLSPLVPFTVDSENTSWFMPALFFSATCMQWIIYLKQGAKKPEQCEISYGVMGGLANGVATFFLILAPQVATSWENPLIFPLFAISIILICNVWSNLLYKEKVNWKASALCLGGLAVAAI